MHKCPSCGRMCLCGAVGLCQCAQTPEPDGCLIAAPVPAAAPAPPIDNPLDVPLADRERDE